MSLFFRRPPRTLLLAACLLSSALQGAELEERASRAFDAYAAGARELFVRQMHGSSRVIEVSGSGNAWRDGDGVAAWPARGNGIVEVPGGLIHHWAGSVFIPGATLRQALAVSRAYPDYRSIYRSVLASTLLARNGESFRVLLRVREGLLGAHAVLDVRSRVEYLQPGERLAYVVSSDEEIREVENPGQSDEHRLAAGRDRGYLWRSGTLTSFVEDDAGLRVELQTLGLSREFPPLLRWIADPIARRIGRKSVESSLEDFRSAVLGRLPGGTR